MFTSKSILAVLSAIALASAQIKDAPVVTNNPAGASYEAVIKAGNITGSVNATSDAGKAVSFTLEVSGLPAGAGPFTYHIHQFPVPADGNCTGTGAHLDPYLRGTTPACDSTKPASCQTGDLSGKYGAISANSTSAVKIFNDPYVALNPSDASFFGNLSFVIHNAANARIACSNFTKVATRAGGGDSCS